ncbi:MAG: phosphotransferase family protein [Georgfuchsia sp.]
MTESILETLDRLQQRSDLPKDAIFDLSVIATALRHAQHVETSNGDDIREHGRRFAELLQAMKVSEIVATAPDKRVNALLGTIIDAASSTASSPLQGNFLKQAFIKFLYFADQQFAEIVRIAPDIALPLFADFTSMLLRQHNSLVLFGKHDTNSEPEVSPGDRLTEANLTAYFQEKLADATASATKLMTLTGGFGKETTLFSLSSKTLNADLVLRRDSPIDVYKKLDCHTATREYPLLKAVHSRGFPAPEPILLEEKPLIIKGPSFTIMRRIPGVAVGDATGGQGMVSAELTRTLAQVAARLHSTEPLTELSNIPAFDSALWKMTASECARTYIEASYQRYLNTSHLPMPVLHGLYSWLLAHVPITDEPPALVHGDIGFHNLLLNEGELSAVLDWEFAHVGDPAEDIGYIRSLMANQLDWPRFIAEYQGAGGTIPSEERVRFFEIWAQVRNATSSVITVDHFKAGRYRNIRYGWLVFRYMPHFIAQAETLIANFDKY